tara:strand:+ start:2497 stop:3339 length:843 start_codon:yes stop_codon:yes gene_type:complete
MEGETHMKQNVAELQATANIMRQDIVRMVNAAGSGHPGGSLSAADIVAALYFNVMDIDPQDPKKVNRDKFVLSKGHAAPVLYAALANRGFFAKEEILKLRKFGAMLQGHPDMKGTPGVDMSTGSLGQGISTAVGMALANKIDGRENRVYTLLGDGEINEGLVWEALMAGAHYKLNNLTAILDYNGLQIDGANDDVMGIKPVDKKFASFGWNVIEIDGHDMDAILAAFEEAKKETEKPSVILANTVKGKGVSFMEGDYGWHGQAPNEEQLAQALKDLGGDC